MKPKKYNKGNMIYQEGDSDSNLYLIMEGEIEISSVF
jgi:CRP-like cAMP-binding protein